MKRILGRKQSMDNARWLEAAANIEELVTQEELEEAVATVIEDIKTHAEGKSQPMHGAAVKTAWYSRTSVRKSG